MENNQLELGIDFIVLPNKPIKLNGSYVYTVKVISEKGFKLLSNGK